MLLAAATFGNRCRADLAGRPFFGSAGMADCPAKSDGYYEVCI